LNSVIVKYVIDLSSNAALAAHRDVPQDGPGPVTPRAGAVCLAEVAEDAGCERMA
jgi:hypothetical protein